MIPRQGCRKVLRLKIYGLAAPVPDQVPREVLVISATLIFPRYFLTAMFIRSLLSLTFEKIKNNCVTPFPIPVPPSPPLPRLPLSAVRRSFTSCLGINKLYFKRDKNRTNPILRNSHRCSYANFIIVRVIIHESTRSIRGRCQSVKGIFLSLSLFPCHGSAIELGGGGAPAPFVFTPD